MNIRQVNAIKNRTINRDGGQYREGSLQHIFKICPGPQDYDDAEGQQRMLQEAYELKQIRKERFIQRIESKDQPNVQTTVDGGSLSLQNQIRNRNISVVNDNTI